MARTGQASARSRARAAMRERAAARELREQQVAAAAERYFAAEVRVAEATADLQAAVVELVDDLGEPASAVADLLGLEAKDVSRIRRAAKAARSEDVPLLPADGTPHESAAGHA